MLLGCPFTSNFKQLQLQFDFPAAPAPITVIELERGQVCSVDKEKSTNNKKEKQENKAPTSLDCFPGQQHDRPIPREEKKRRPFPPHGRDCNKPANCTVSGNARESGPDPRGIRQIWRRAGSKRNDRREVRKGYLSAVR
jgi:hypothetical protein